MKILLINPGQLPDAGTDQFSGSMDGVYFRISPFKPVYFGLPLALPTLAGVTPDIHDVVIIDEMIEPIDFEQPVDLVGITAMTSKATRAYQIAAEFRRRRVKVVMGGIHASMCPDEAAQHVDCVVVGEADEIWREVVADAENGVLKPIYRPAFPSLENAVPPRYASCRATQYFSFFLQTTRGCPRNCNFCTVTQINGRKLRTKSPQQVVNEVREILSLPGSVAPVMVDKRHGNRSRRLASGAIFFVDDNFAINRQHALAVCQSLTQLQNELNVHLNWFTQADIKIGFDHELLEAMKDAGCLNIFIGFESLNKDSLNAMNKQVNTPELYITCIRNIESHGIEVIASVILGADEDNARCGESMASFATKNDHFYLFPNILTPYPGTEIMTQMDATDRVLHRNWERYNIRNVVFLPAQMTAGQLRRQYVELCQRVLNMRRLFEVGQRKCAQPKRYYLTRRWRAIILWVFTMLTIVLWLRKKLTFAEARIILRHIPWLIWRNGSLNALGFIVNAIGFGTFARSELARLHKDLPDAPSNP